MSGSSGPKLACRNQLRSCSNSIIIIQSDDEVEGKGKKMRDFDGKGKGKNMNIASVCLEKEKERLNNSSSSKKKTPTTDDYKEGKKKKFNEVKNAKASHMQTEDDVNEVEIWTDHSKSKKRKVSTVSCEREERHKSLNNGNCGKKVHGNGNEREENYVWRSDSTAHEEITVTSFEKEKKQKRVTNNNGGTKRLHIDAEEEEKQFPNLDRRIRSGDSSATFFEKGKERTRQNSTNNVNEKKLQGGDKKRMLKMDTAMLKVGKRLLHHIAEKKKKMSSHGNVDEKINEADKNISPLFNKDKMQNKGVKKKTEPITNVANAKKMRPTKNTKMKMQHGLKQKKRDAPSNTSKEKKTKAHIEFNYEKRKREKSNTLSEKVKRMQSDDKKRKIHGGKVKENNCMDLEDKKRNTPFSFFKVMIYSNLKESMSIPPKVALELEDLINQHVYLEDSEGNLSEIRLSVVNGHLAFHQGWSTFVSDHQIEHGEILLFEYNANSTFFVRIFGIDSRERLHFNVGRKSEGVRKKEVHTNRSHDDFISLDGEYPSPRSKESVSHHVTVDTTEYPKRVERMIGSESVILDSRNGDKVIQPCRPRDISPLRSKEKTVILITDSGSSIHENDSMKLTLTADSSTQHMAGDMKEVPKRVQNGIGGRQSALVGDEKGRLTDAEFRTKCSEKKAMSTARSGIENGLSDVAGDEKESLPDVECGTKCTSLKCTENKAASTVESGPSAELEDEEGSLPAVECGTKCKSPKCSEKKVTSTVQSGTEKGVSAILEHENGSSPAVECGTRCISPKCNKNETACVDAALLKQQNDVISKDDLKLHDSYEISSIHLECTTAVNKYNDDGETNASPYVCRNYEAPGGFRCLEKWRNSIARDWVVLDGTGLNKSESTRENGRPIKDLAHPKSMSTCEHDGTEINHSISGKGTIAQLETKSHFEPMVSIEGIQSTNVPVYVDNAAARQSESCFFIQQDDRSLLKTNMQFCIPNTTQKWLDLPRSLPNAIRGRNQDRNTVVFLKDAMERLWPVVYPRTSMFVGFTAGWKPFAAANNLETGDLCELLQEADEVYSVRITKK